MVGVNNRDNTASHANTKAPPLLEVVSGHCFSSTRTIFWGEFVVRIQRYIYPLAVIGNLDLLADRHRFLAVSTA